ncbi:MAG: CAP domain-containing protein [Myxococcota bacterium]
MSRRTTRVGLWLLLALLPAAGLLACTTGPSTRSTKLPAPEAARSCPAPTITADALRSALHERTAAHRKAQGLGALDSHERVDAIAQQHSFLMAGRAAMTHDGSQERFKAVSAVFGWPHAAGNFAENVAEVCGDVDAAAKQAFEAWLASSDHRENIEGDFRVTGIGVTQGRSGWIYIAQLFYLPRET